MQHEPEDELEQRPTRAPERYEPAAWRAPAVPSQRAPEWYAPPRPHAPPDVPPDVLRDVTRLSQPAAPGADAYVLAPPPAWTPGLRRAPIHDRVLAAAAHAAIIFGFVGFGFLIALGITLVIWLYSRRSPYVAYHARQAGYYQLFVLGLNIFLLFWVLLLFGFYLLYPHWGFVGVLAAWLTGVEGVWFVGSILLGILGAVLVILGRSFAYPLFGRKKP